jgi:hypothetical protein
MARRSSDELPAPLPATDHVTRAIRLLEWARAKGVRIGPTLQVGDVIMQVTDMRQRAVDGTGGPADDVPQGPYAEHGLSDDEEPAPGTAG